MTAQIPTNKLPCYICGKGAYTMLFLKKKGDPYLICSKHLKALEDFVRKLKVSQKK